MRSRALALVAFAPFALSCGGDDGPPPHVVGQDAAVVPDAPAPAACGAQATYTPAFGSDNQRVDEYPAMGSGADATIHQMYYSGALDDAPDGDLLFIDLYQDYGAFTGSDIGSGEFTLTGDETNYSTCGICVTIGNHVDDNGVSQWYMATGGIVTLTSVMGRLTGHLQNINFRRVVTDANGGPGDDPLAGPSGDCTSHIGSADFDAPIMLGSATARIAIPVSRLGIGRPRLPTKLHHRYY